MEVVQAVLPFLAGDKRDKIEGRQFVVRGGLVVSGFILFVSVFFFFWGGINVKCVGH